MNGRTHLIYGFGIVCLVCTFLLWVAFKDVIYGAPSLLMVGVGGAFGALFPDFDLYLGIDKHRSILTHSSLLPLLVTLAYAFEPSVEARTLLLFICVGMTTHLTFDLFLSDTPKKYHNIISRWGYRLYYFGTGKVGGSFKGFGAEWANKHERVYLIIHASICVGLALVLFWGIYNGIDIDGLFW